MHEGPSVGLANLMFQPMGPEGEGCGDGTAEDHGQDGEPTLTRAPGAVPAEDDATYFHEQSHGQVGRADCRDATMDAAFHNLDASGHGWEVSLDDVEHDLDQQRDDHHGPRNHDEQALRIALREALQPDAAPRLHARRPEQRVGGAGRLPQFDVALHSR